MLSCKVQGTPVINISWFKNGEEIAPDHRHRMSFDNSVATLEVDSCSVEDSGEYVCMATSEAGKDQCSSTVTVKGWLNLELLLLIKFNLFMRRRGTFGPQCSLTSSGLLLIQTLNRRLVWSLFAHSFHYLSGIDLTLLDIGVDW